MKTVFEKKLPKDLNAESIVLGSLLMEPKHFNRVNQLLTPGDFSLIKHGLIYQTMLDMQDFNLISLKHELDEKKKLDEIGGSVYLTDLMDKALIPSNVVIHAKTVKEKAQSRK